MQNVDTILQQLDDNSDIKEIRRAIADLIAHHLQSLQNSFGYWEKVHFANAIAALAWNINSSHQPTEFWLRLCLVSLEKALVPVEKRNENYIPRDKQIDNLTYEQLSEDIESVRKMVC